VTPRNLRILFLALFVWILGWGLYDDLFPIYARGLGATPLQLGFLFTVRQLTLTAGSVLGGILSDRYSRRAVMLPSWFLGAPVPLLFLAAPSWAWLLPGILLYELTIFGLPALNAYIADRTDPERLASTFALIMTASSLALLIAPGLGGLIAQRWGIRTTFFLGFLCYTLSTVLIFLTEPDRRTARTALPWRQALRFWEMRGLWPVLVMLGTMTGVPIALAPFVAPFLREVRGLSLAQIGGLGSVLSAGGLLFTLAAGRAADRWGHAPVLVSTLLLIAAGTLLVAFGPVYLLPVAFLIRSRSAAQSLAQAVVGGRVTPAAAGRAFGLLGMVTGLVGAGGTLLSGLGYRTNPVLPLAAGAGVVITLATVLLVRRQTLRAPAVE